MSEIKDYPVACQHCKEGKLEASSVIWLDVDKVRIGDDGKVYLIKVSPSHLNDYVNGIPLNIESEFKLSCDSCGMEPTDWDMDDAFTASVAPQPVGNAERVIGRRGGMDDADEVAVAGPLLRTALKNRLAAMDVGETTSEDVYDIERDGDSEWTVWEDGEHYNYTDIDAVIDHLLEGG